MRAIVSVHSNYTET